MRSALPALIALSVAEPALAAQRFAVVAGNNVGGLGAQDLRYAASDARGFRTTLTELGDFPSDHVVLLENGSAADLRGALAQVEHDVAAVRATGEYVLLLFYYSGHADDDGLRLGYDTVTYDEIRRTLVNSQASAKIAIVDACSSGSLTRVKASKPVAGMAPTSTLQDTAVGLVYIASTATGEYAIESDRIHASYFTARLQEGLHGAADFDGDGRVSLTEAFHYAQSRTTADTLENQQGVQHPTFDVNLSGRGDVILTELRRAQVSLVLPPAVGKTYTLLHSQVVIGEIAGSATPINLALAPGAYTVELRGDASLLRTDVDVRSVAQALPEMRPITLLPGTRSGVYLNPRISAGLSVSTGVLPGTLGMPVGSLSIDIPVRPIRIQLGAEVGGDNVVYQGLPYSLVTAGAEVTALVPVLWTASGDLEVGGQLGYGWDVERVPLLATFGTGDGWAGAEVRYLFRAGPVEIGPQLTGRAHLLVSRADGLAPQWTVTPTAELGVVAAFGL